MQSLTAKPSRIATGHGIDTFGILGRRQTLKPCEVYEYSWEHVGVGAKALHIVLVINYVHPISFLSKVSSFSCVELRFTYRFVLFVF